MCWCTSVTLAPQDLRLEASEIQSQHLKTSTHMYVHKYKHTYVCVCVYLRVCSYVMSSFTCLLTWQISCQMQLKEGRVYPGLSLGGTAHGGRKVAAAGGEGKHTALRA